MTEFYVSKTGNDANSGTFAEPFATPPRALEAVRCCLADDKQAQITVYIHGGDYRNASLKFMPEDSGEVTFKAYGDGEVILNGGKTLKNCDFAPVTDEKVLARFKPEVREYIKVIDLKSQGLTYDEVGPLYAVGCANNADKYDDGTNGNNCEFFWNDERMTLARYPNNDFCKIEEVVELGDEKQRIPGVVRFDDEVVRVMQTWQNPESAWIFGYFKFDWAEMTCPIKKIDVDKGIVWPAHYSTYGYTFHAPCYFLNVLEELDCEGEYYIDRENMLLYVYPPKGEETADALISITQEKLVEGEVSGITFEGITFKGVRNDVMVLNGDNITVRNCRVLNSYGKGIVINGWNNYVYGCEIAYMGRGGVYLTGGDRATLTPGNCVVENCYIHHFEEIYRTYQQGIFLLGCGNKAIHNELAYAPHLAISYTGNNHEIAYNYIHHVVYESNDAGALYVGGDWTSCGTVVKYNLFKDIGGVEGKWPIAIYYDDGMSSGTVVGNIIENCYGFGFMIGGGRDMIVRNNLFISHTSPIQYDARMGHGGWADVYAKIKPGEGIWTTLDRVPYTSELWKKTFPRLASVTTDYNDCYSPDFPSNPAYSFVEHNVFVGERSDEGFWVIEDEVKKYSTIKDNYSFAKKEDVLVPGTYTVTDEAMAKYSMVWENVDYKKIGRY